MKTRMLCLVYLLTVAAISNAQSDKNPVLKNYSSSYYDGRVVCIGTSSYENELRATDIKTKDIEKIIDDYKNSFRSYKFSSILDITRALETKEREVQQLEKKVETLERKLSDLDRKISDLERKIK